MAAGAAQIKVATSGPPTAAADVPALLEPFRRGGVARAGHGDGHGQGLGLSIVVAIADAHSAELSVQARPDGGLEVPIAFAAEADEQTRARPVLTGEVRPAAESEPTRTLPTGPRRPWRLRRSATSRSG